MIFTEQTRKKLFTATGLSDAELTALEELSDFLPYDTEAEFLQAIKNNEDPSEAVGNWADGQVSIYTDTLYEWALQNIRAVQEHEEELLSSGYKSIDSIFGVCWYRAEEERKQGILADLRKAL